MSKQNRNLGVLLLLGIVLLVVGVFAVFVAFTVSILLIVVGSALFFYAGRKANVFNRMPYVGPIPAATAPSAPPLPDTVLVKCSFCGTVQPYREKCAQCGAPLPRP